MLEKIGGNPLLVSIITLVLTAIIGGIGFLIKKVMEEKQENMINKNATQQSNIIQNFSTGMSYNDVRKIAEDVLEDKLNEIGKM